jgi:hypothetical protein
MQNLYYIDIIEKGAIVCEQHMGQTIDKLLLSKSAMAYVSRLTRPYTEHDRCDACHIAQYAAAQLVSADAAAQLGNGRSWAPDATWRTKGKS